MLRFFEMAPEEFHGKIPFIVTDLITELRRRNSEKVEGIFRLNGSDTKIRELCTALDHGRIDDLSKYDDIHTVATALKRYFRNMAEHEPLVTTDVYSCLTTVMLLNQPDREVELTRQVIDMLVPVRRYTLSYLMKYLHEICANQKTNLMTAKNIGVCFGPNLVTSPDVAPEDAVQYGLLANRAVEVMVEKYEEIFAGLEVTEDMFCNDDDFIEFNRPPINLIHIQHQMFRCQFRRDKIIPFVPLCQLLKQFKRPTRPLPAVGDTEDEEDARFTSMLTTLRFDKSDAAELLHTIKHNVTEGRRMSTAVLEI